MMFDLHAPRIANYAQRSPDNLFHVLEFVICTVRMPLKTCVGSMKELARQGERSKCLWGWKAAAWRHTGENRQRIWDQALVAMAAEDAERALLAHFAGLPGFGMVKGGFAAQLAFGVAGCIDMHNAERFQIRNADIRGNRFKEAKRQETREKRLDIYLDICHALGGTAKLWNGWCEYLAKVDGRYNDNPFYVSGLHCEALGLSAEE